MPAVSQASLAASRVTSLTSRMASPVSVQGSLARIEAATLTVLQPNCRAFSSEA